MLAIFTLVAVAAGLLILLSTGILFSVPIVLGMVIWKKGSRMGRRHSRRFHRSLQHAPSYRRRPRTNTSTPNAP